MFKNPFNSDESGSTTTISKIELADLRGQLAAIHKFQCIAEYTMDGKIIIANENYLNLTGYTLSELTGQDIGMLLDLKYRHSAKNSFFWDRLNNGDYISGKFKRIVKGVKTIWIQATYCPMMDLNGKLIKVIEYATDITEQVQLERALTRAVEQVQEVVLATKNGDLTQLIPLEEKSGEIARLCINVNSLIEYMATIIGMINKTGGFIIDASNKALAQRKEKQSPSPEEATKDL